MLGWWIGRLSAMRILLSTCTYMMTWRMLRGLSLSLSLYITNIIHSYLFESRTSSPLARIYHIAVHCFTCRCRSMAIAVLTMKSNVGEKHVRNVAVPCRYSKRGGDILHQIVLCPHSVVRVLVDSGNLQTALRMVLRRVDKLGPCEEQLWIHVEGAPSKPRSVRCSGCSPVVADNLKCFTSWSQQREWTVPGTRPGVYEMLF
jgi:hypothetical protein